MQRSHWVPFVDAEAEIEKARKEGRIQGNQEGAESIRMAIENARADERKRIEAEYRRLRFDHLAEDAFLIAIKLSSEPGPKPLEKSERESFDEWSWVKLWDRVNALVDAVRGIQNWIAGQNI